MVKGYSSYLVLGMTLICLQLGSNMAKADEEKALKVTKQIVEKQIAPRVEAAQKRFQKKALKAIGFEQQTAEQIGAAVMIGKAVVEKKIKLKLNKNFDVEVDASDRNDKRIKFGFTKGF